MRERPTNNVKKPPILPRRSHSPAAPRSQKHWGDLMELRELAFEWIIVVEKGKNECQLLKMVGHKIKMLTWNFLFALEHMMTWTSST
jgi:hypothetical protein